MNVALFWSLHQRYTLSCFTIDNNKTLLHFLILGFKKIVYNCLYLHLTSCLLVQWFQVLGLKLKCEIKLRKNLVKLRKRSLTCYKVDTKMDDIQHSGSSKSKMASIYRSRCMCCVLETNLTRKFAADLPLQIFLIYYISS